MYATNITGTGTMCDNESKFDLENDQYIETPWNIIETYFEGQHLERLVRHQLESYNNFVDNQITKTIDMFNAKEATDVRYNMKDTILKGINFSTENQKNDSDENELCWEQNDTPNSNYPIGPRISSSLISQGLFSLGALLERPIVCSFLTLSLLSLFSLTLYHL